MLQMRPHDGFESIGSRFGKIASGTSVDVHGNESRNDEHSLCVDDLGANNGKVAVGYFQYFPVTDKDRAVFQPALRGKDMTIYNLCQHNLSL